MFDTESDKVGHCHMFVCVRVCMYVCMYACMYADCSDQLDAIAQKKLVNFVHDLMTQYFDFVCRRVQLEVLTISDSNFCRLFFLLKSSKNAVNRMRNYRSRNWINYMGWFYSVCFRAY